MTFNDLEHTFMVKSFCMNFYKWVLSLHRMK